MSRTPPIVRFLGFSISMLAACYGDEPAEFYIPAGANLSLAANAPVPDPPIFDVCDPLDCGAVIAPMLDETRIKASNAELADDFGASVAIDGETLVVGVPGEDSGATGVDGDQEDNSVVDSGAAYVFVRCCGRWTQQAYLKANHADVHNHFGASVAISGETIVVGESYGAASVWVRANGRWTQQGQLTVDNENEGAFGGVFVAIDGDTVLMGVPSDGSDAVGINGDQTDNTVPGRGGVHAFVRRSSTWSHQAYIKPVDRDVYWFGHSLGLEGDTAVVGAPGDLGAAYVFVRNGSAWIQHARLTASNADSGDQFGVSVAIDGDTVVIGASMEASNTTGINGNERDNSVWRSGAAYVFRRSDMQWRQDAYLKAGHRAAMEFGWSVAAADGLILVGGPADYAEVDVFGSGGDACSPERVLRAGNASWDDFFGTSVAISDDIIVVGAIGESSNATGINDEQYNFDAWRSGAVYVFPVTAAGAEASPYPATDSTPE